MSDTLKKAIVLAAGYGTRLKPLTELRPKALVPVVGRPLLRHSIARLIASGISTIGINAHHHSDHIEQFAAAQTDCVLHISREPDILGSAGGIGGFREFLEDEDFFLVCNADSISDIDSSRFLPDFLCRAPLVTMILTDNPATNNVCVDSNLAVIDLRDRLRPPGIAARLTYTGMAFMSRAFLELVPPGSSELVPLLLERIAKSPGSVRAAIARNAAWRDIGTIASYLESHGEIMLHGKPLIPEIHMPPGPLQLGEGSFIDTRCDLEGFISIGSNCRIETGCRLRNCVIWDNTILPAGTHLDNSVCAQGMIINGR